MRRASGFTLLEMLIAFAILSLAVVAIYAAIAAAMTRSARLGEEEPALTLAESLLEQYSVAPLFEDSSDAGTQGRLRWNVTTLRQEPVAGGSAAIAVVEVRSRVAWGAPGSKTQVELARLAFARVPPVRK